MISKTKKQRGITLIALVVTIVVLLILAGVSIATLTGENGIITQANNSKEQTEVAEEKEQIELAFQSALLNNVAGGGVTAEALERELIANGITQVKVTGTENLIVEFIGTGNLYTVTNTGKVSNKESLEGEGTERNPYVISNIEDLVFFAYDVREGNTYEGKYVKLEKSLDFNSEESYKDAHRTDYGKYGYEGELKTILTSGEGWIPIGTIETDNINKFSGVFDGNNCIISNLWINKQIETDYASDRFYGFFSRCNGTIKNLTVTNNIEINTTSDAIYVGGIAGGIVGQSSGTIENCKNSANISADYHRVYIGGITGSNYVGNIYNSYNTGKIVLENNYQNMECAGGITGWHYRGDLNYCFNLGEVVGNYWTGAIVGHLQESSSVFSTITNTKYSNSNINGLGNYTENTIETGKLQVEIIQDESLTEDKVLEIINNIE